MGVPGRRPLTHISSKTDDAIATLVGGERIDRAPELIAIDTPLRDTLCGLVIKPAVEAALLESITPGVNTAGATPGRFFPLLLGGETTATPGRVCLSVPPVDPNDGAVQINLAAEEFPALDRGAMVLMPFFRLVRGLLGRLIGMTNLQLLFRIGGKVSKEFGVIGYRDLVASDPEFAQFNFLIILKRENTGGYFRVEIEFAHLGLGPHHEEGDNRPRDNEESDERARDQSSAVRFLLRDLRQFGGGESLLRIGRIECLAQSFDRVDRIDAVRAHAVDQGKQSRIGNRLFQERGDRVGEQLHLFALFFDRERIAAPAHGVGNAGLGSLNNENALRREKAMGHAVVAQIDERARGRRENFPEDRIVQLAAAEGEITEAGCVDQFESVEVHPQLLIALIHERNRRVIDRGAGTRLVHESLHPPDVFAVLAIERLERDMASDRRLLGLVEGKIGVPLDLA